MTSDDLATTNRLLKVIVALLLRRRESEVLNLKQQIHILNDLALKPIEIAEILGRSNTYINKELSGLRKAQREKG